MESQIRRPVGRGVREVMEVREGRYFFEIIWEPFRDTFTRRPSEEEKITEESRRRPQVNGRGFPGRISETYSKSKMRGFGVWGLG